MISHSLINLLEREIGTIRQTLKLTCLIQKVSMFLVGIKSDLFILFYYLINLQ
jgi:hypothetical protein